MDQLKCQIIRMITHRLNCYHVCTQSLNPMSARLLSLFQTENGDSALMVEDGVTFSCFVRTLDFFNARTPPEVKLAALFRLYDCDGDGRVSERDLRSVMRLYMGTHVSEAALRVMSRNTMSHALAKCTNIESSNVSRDNNTKKGSISRGMMSDVIDRRNEDESSEESEGRSLSFEQFCNAIGPDALDSMNVAVPIRE
jgi:hypothetical protein